MIPKLLRARDFYPAPHEADVISRLDSKLHIKFSLDENGDVHTVFVCDSLEDSCVSLLFGLSKLTELHVLHFPPSFPGKLTETGIASMATHLRLQSLSLQNARVTPAMLQALTKIRSLRWLHLNSCGLNDAHLPLLSRGCTELLGLGLNWNTVTDSGLKSLSTMYKLRWLSVVGTCVTRSGAMAFMEDRQTCRVFLESDGEGECRPS